MSKNTTESRARMRTIDKSIIILMKSAITGKSYTLPEDFSLSESFYQIRKHTLMPLIYAGVLNCGIPKEDPEMQKLFIYYREYLNYSEKQMAAVKRIYTAFEANGIDYMPVKGCNLKLLYPAPEMRPMSDADILIKQSQYHQIEKLMKELGYVLEHAGDHDYGWCSGNIHIELHYRLILPYNQAYKEYFGSGWNLAAMQNNHHFYMNPEDEFIYLFIHFTKHYRLGSVGCRQVLDLWIYLRTYPDLDKEYIEKKIRELSVSEFYHNMLTLIDYWFNNGKGNEKAEYISEYILTSGNGGTYENRVKAYGVMNAQLSGSKVKGKIHTLRKAVFPDLSDLKMRYTVLKKVPVLLPAVWVYRWFDAVLTRKDNVKALTKRVRGVCTLDLSDFENSLSYVGLDFTFEEGKDKES